MTANDSRRTNAKSRQFCGMCCAYIANALLTARRPARTLIVEYNKILRDIPVRRTDTDVDNGARGAQPPPNGRAKKKGRGYFYQMSNMYTCIAYLIEIRKFCSKKPGS